VTRSNSASQNAFEIKRKRLAAWLLLRLTELRSVAWHAAFPLRRLLLGQAVQGAQAPDQIHGMDAYHGTIPEQFAQNAQRHPVLWGVERRHDDSGVANVEIRIARRQPHPVKIQRRWHRQFDHLRPAAIFQAQIPDAFPVFGERPVICVARIVFAYQYERFGVHKPADVVNVAVGIIPLGAFGQPENVRHSKIVFERRLDFPLAESWIVGCR